MLKSLQLKINYILRCTWYRTHNPINDVKSDIIYNVMLSFVLGLSSNLSVELESDVLVLLSWGDVWITLTYGLDTL